MKLSEIEKVFEKFYPNGEPCEFTAHAAAQICEAIMKSNENDIWIELFNDLDKWSRSTKSSKDTPIKINELKTKYTLKIK